MALSITFALRGKLCALDKTLQWPKYLPSVNFIFLSFSFTSCTLAGFMGEKQTRTYFYHCWKYANLARGWDNGHSHTQEEYKLVQPFWKVIGNIEDIKNLNMNILWPKNSTSGNLSQWTNWTNMQRHKGPPQSIVYNKEELEAS